MPRKKVVKKPIKQKQKVKVSQNVKVIIGDVKRKQVRKVTGQKAGAGAKPPIVLNISNPQPYNNMFMEYFKKQLQNQQPVQANTLNQHERINEQEETKASKAGALSKIDQEPNDQARELRKQAAEQRARFQVAQAEQKGEAQQVRSSLKPVKKDDPRVAATPLRPIAPHPRRLLMSAIEAAVPQTPPTMDREMLAELQAQQNSLTNALEKSGGAGEPVAQPVAQPAAVRAVGAKRGPKPSDLYTPQEQDTRASLLEMLSGLTESDLDKKLTGTKLKAYMHRLGLANRERGSTNPLPVQAQRIAIMGLIQNYKRDKGYIK